MSAPNEHATLGKGASTAHIAPLADDELASVQDVVDLARKFSGYVPTSFRIMARKPDLLRAFNGLVAAVMRDPGELPAELKWLIAHVISASAGCRYCQAHTAANSAKAGLPVTKIEALMEYETGAIFSPAERAAVALALAAGQVPNASTRDHFDALRPHFSETAIVEIVAVISLFGWLNRWNDTLASDLEAAPLGFASMYLGPTDNSSVTVHIPFQIRRRGGRKLILAPDGSTVGIETRCRVDNALVKALARGFRWRKLLETGVYATIEEIAAKERINSSYVGRLLRLALLAPDIVEAILDGRQPPEMTLAGLMEPPPVAWHEQRLRIASARSAYAAA